MTRPNRLVPALCQQIRAERVKAEATQEELAHRLGMSLAGYRNYEIEREPRPPRLRQIARALNLPEDYFLHGGVDKKALEQRVEELSDRIGQLTDLVQRLQ